MYYTNIRWKQNARGGGIVLLKDPIELLYFENLKKNHKYEIIMHCLIFIRMSSGST